MSAAPMEYELDTARAKTPAERMRIVADLMDAQERGQEVLLVGSAYAPVLTKCEIQASATKSSFRLVTKRRPALVIPALELFEGAERMMADGQVYYAPDPCNEIGYGRCVYAFEIAAHKETLDGGCCFASPEAAARVGLHIRDALAKAVAK